ncbi:alpha/beta hydrolase family protein [Nonomuraea insulae]|uniref:poly(ethylene terephthalate) hydrolase n=1 Tax=Nonomuraea insulae TaxID=1616787 RepID=A0ABW1DCZ1_9ACTN
MVKTFVAAGLVVLTAAACTAPAAPRTDPAAFSSASALVGKPATLPAPTGPHPVGATLLFLKDTSRPDPWEPTAPARELKVTLWYPAKTRAGERAPYTSAKESELLLKAARVGTVPFDLFSRTRTNAVKDAEPAGEKGGLPLVVLSPGWTKPVSTLTSLAEELASQGYVVAGIDHPYESYATALPGGRIAECVACDFDTDPGFDTRVVQSRAADVSFTLDELIDRYPELIDRSRIAMAGQSIGGAGAVAAMVKDSRIRAGINMDGTTYARIPKKDGLSRPFLLLGNPEHVPGGRDHSWDRDWKLLTGWKRWLMVSGGDHQSFTDFPALAASVGQRAGGTLTAARAAELTRTYVTAFLDLHLRGKREPLLDEPSPRYPEVKFCGRS